jgi:hypothetical protein
MTECLLTTASVLPRLVFSVLATAGIDGLIVEVASLCDAPIHCLVRRLHGHAVRYG